MSWVVMDPKHIGEELKKVSEQLRTVRLRVDHAWRNLESATEEVERLERVIWAIGADLDGRP